MLSKQADTHQ